MCLSPPQSPVDQIIIECDNDIAVRNKKTRKEPIETRGVPLPQQRSRIMNDDEKEGNGPKNRSSRVPRRPAAQKGPHSRPSNFTGIAPLIAPRAHRPTPPRAPPTEREVLLTWLCTTRNRAIHTVWVPGTFTDLH